jgi:hypothetical protein
VGGVRLTIAGSRVFTVITGGDGLFSQSNLPGGTYVLTPTLADLTFTPLTRTVVISTANATGVTFTAYISQTFGITGSIRTAGGDGWPNVQVVTVNDHLRLTTQTGAHGHFAQTGLISGTYALTPMLRGATFDPPTRTVVVTQADRLDLDFVVTYISYLPLVTK